MLTQVSKPMFSKILKINKCKQKLKRLRNVNKYQLSIVNKCTLLLRNVNLFKFAIKF